MASEQKTTPTILNSKFSSVVAQGFDWKFGLLEFRSEVDDF